MHVYSIDKDIRRKVIVGLFCVSIFISLILKFVFRTPAEYITECIRKVTLFDSLYQMGNFLDMFGDIISTPTIYALLYILFDNVLWKVKWINKFLGIPNLNGVWKGKAKSSFDESKEYSMELTVKQTWSKISFVSEFLDTNSKSQSNSAAFFIEANGDNKIGFSFVNNSREVNSQQYEGYNILEIDDENEISGRYFNNRDSRLIGIAGGNKGQFKIERTEEGHT